MELKVIVLAQTLLAAVPQNPFNGIERHAVNHSKPEAHSYHGIHSMELKEVCS